MVAPIVHVYMLTEDAGAHSHATWEALLRRMCRLVDSSCDTQPAAFFVEQPEEGARKTMAGNGWRERKHSRRVIDFWKVLAEQLEDKKIVVFHVDGDVLWPLHDASADSHAVNRSMREASANVRDVHEIAIQRIHDIFESLGRSPSEISTRLACFVPVHPFREIEAWLFHNVTVLRRLCARRSIAFPARAEAWAVQPELLDAEPSPKEMIPFHAEHNQDLAEDAFPAEQLYRLGSSFYAAVETMKRCTPLRTALQRTYAAERWQS